MKYVIWGLIGAYFVFVCIKRIKDYKNGKYCSCGCDGCKHNCSKKDKNEGE